MKTELEQQIWSESTRLITNAIIFYNAYILSKLLKKKEANGMEETDFIKAISPVAWRHINLYGVYEFHRKASPINVSAIINNLDEKLMGIHLAATNVRRDSL